MATIQQFDDSNNPQGQNGQGGSPLSNSPGGGSSGGQPSQTPQANNSQRKGSGRFTNISQYLNANQGAGQQLATGISNNVNKEADKVGQSIASTQGIQSGIQSEQERVGKAGEIAGTIKGLGSGGDANKALESLQSATQLRTGQSNVADLEKQSQQALGTINQNVQNVGNLANQSNTETGRFDLLKKTYGQPGYTQGAQKLDQMFVQNDGSQTLGKLQRGLAGTFKQGQQQLGDITNQLNTGIGGVKAGVAQGQQLIQNAVGKFGADPGDGALNQLYSGLNAQKTQAEAAQADLVKRAREQIKTGELDKDVAESLGINDGMAYYNTDLGQYANNISAKNANASLADVAQDDQIARINALKQFGGLADGDVNLGTKGSGFGTAFDTAGFKSTIEAAGKDNIDQFNKQSTDFSGMSKGFFDKLLSGASRFGVNGLGGNVLGSSGTGIGTRSVTGGDYNTMDSSVVDAASGLTKRDLAMLQGFQNSGQFLAREAAGSGNFNNTMAANQSIGSNDDIIKNLLSATGRNSAEWNNDGVRNQNAANINSFISGGGFDRIKAALGDTYTSAANDLTAGVRNYGTAQQNRFGLNNKFKIRG
jgi:hypothetical protein